MSRSSQFPLTAAVVGLLLLACPPFLQACDSDKLVGQLEAIEPALTSAQLDQTRAIVQAHCQQLDETRPDDVAHNVHPVTAGTAATATGTDTAEETPPTLFGIEFRKADKDSKGHDRLKK